MEYAVDDIVVDDDDIGDTTRVVYISSCMIFGVTIPTDIYREFIHVCNS